MGDKVQASFVFLSLSRDRGFRGAGCAIAHPENPEGVQTPIFAHPQFVVGAHAALALECPKPILEGPSAAARA